MRKIIEFISILVVMGGTMIAAIEFGQLANLESIANLANVFTGLGWFVGSFIVASLIVSYLVVIAPTKVFLRFLAIPAWLMFSATLLITVDQLMGYSYPAIPPQATVVAYYVYKDADNVEMIEAWMYFKDQGRARAYNFPYTLEREKALQQGQEGAGKGEPVEVDLRKGEGQPDGQEPESMIIYDWDIETQHPGKEQLEEDAPTQMPDLGDGMTYDMKADGEIEVVAPKMEGSKKNDWDDLSTPGEEPDATYFGYGIDDPGY